MTLLMLVVKRSANNHFFIIMEYNTENLKTEMEMTSEEQHIKF